MKAVLVLGTQGTVPPLSERHAKTPRNDINQPRGSLSQALETVRLGEPPLDPKGLVGQCSVMSKIRLIVKQTTGTVKYNVGAEASWTVAQLKEDVARQAESSASDLRLIYKGKILKDAETVESLGASPSDHSQCLWPHFELRFSTMRSGVCGFRS